MRLPYLVVIPILAACSSDAGLETDGAGNGSLSPGVGQGGSQDFGLFRDILLDGGIPGPDTIDDVGFFNEHVIELPPADCGDTVCLHGLLGSMGNMISGSDCTVVQLGMNTPIDPASLPRPPLNLAIAVDTSGSMGDEPMQYVRAGLTLMLDSLEPDDRVTIVDFDSDAVVVAEHLGGDDPALHDAIDALQSGGETNIYSGLLAAYEMVDAHASPSAQNRVILLSDGEATTGLTSAAHIEALAEDHGALGYALTTIGVGSSFDVELMRSLAERGAGAFYFLEDPADVVEVFVEEIEAFLVPLAESVTIDLQVDDAWEVRGVYGTTQYDFTRSSAHIDIPTLQLAHRLDDDDDAHGRRGGGGAILVELLRTADGYSEDVSTVDFAYVDAQTGEPVSQHTAVVAPASEADLDGWFGNAAVEKGFVMLNLYVGFEMAAQDATANSVGSALATLRALDANVAEWLVETPDADIEDDLFYVRLFIDNLEALGVDVHEPEPAEPWPAD